MAGLQIVLKVATASVPKSDQRQVLCPRLPVIERKARGGSILSPVGPSFSRHRPM